MKHETLEHSPFDATISVLDATILVLDAVTSAPSHTGIAMVGLSYDFWSLCVKLLGFKSTVPEVIRFFFVCVCVCVCVCLKFVMVSRATSENFRSLR